MNSNPISWYIALLLGVFGMINTHGNLQAAELPPGVALATLQHLVMNNGAEVSTLDPHKPHGGPEASVMRDLLEGLFNLDIHGQTVPGVAASWQSADNRTWTFYLRPEAKWSNGEPLTAHDFVYSWRRLADPKTGSPRASYLVDMKLVNSQAVVAGTKPPEALGITAIDNNTLRLQLSQPVSYLIDMLTACVLYPVHAATVAQYGNGRDEQRWYAVSHFVGNGAYCLHEWVVNEKLVLVRNDSYWDNRRTIIERVTYLTIADEVVDVRRYRAGEIDITNHLIPTEHHQKLQHTLPNELRCFPSLSVSGYLFNTQKPPFNDVRVRQALSLVLNREAVVSKFLAQGQQATYTLNSEKVQGFKAKLPTWSAWSEKKRHTVARKLLQAAGYSQQKPLRFSLLYNTSGLHEQLAVAISDVWKSSLAVEVILENQEWKVYLNSYLSGNYQAARFGWGVTYNEPSALLNGLVSSSSNNRTFYQSQVFDDWMTQALTTVDAAERCRYYQLAEMQLMRDVPIIPIFHYVNVRLVKPYVGGLSEHNAMNILYTKDLYLIKHAKTPSCYRQ